MYGEAHTQLRHQTWDTIKNISTSSNLPWLCLGNFNEVLHLDEHEGVRQRSNVQIQAFQDKVDVFMLLDLVYLGPTFEMKVTGGTFTMVRLDQVLVSVDWQQRFHLLIKLS